MCVCVCIHILISIAILAKEGPTQHLTLQWAATTALKHPS